MFIERAWKGEVAVWQSVVFVSIGGYILISLMIYAISAALYQMTGIGWFEHYPVVYLRISMILLFLIFGTFSVRSIWKSANNPKGKIGHGIARFWAICIGIYMFALVVTSLPIV